jgi:hypothetical protein
MEKRALSQIKKGVNSSAPKPLSTHHGNAQRLRHPTARNISTCFDTRARVWAAIIPLATTAGTPMPRKVESPQHNKPATGVFAPGKVACPARMADPNVYVTYLLGVYLELDFVRGKTAKDFEQFYSSLHERVRDCCQEAGIRIFTPNYEADQTHYGPAMGDRVSS